MKKLLVFIAILSISNVTRAQLTNTSLTLTGAHDQIKFTPAGQANRYFFMSKPASSIAFGQYSPEDGGWFTYWKIGSGDMIVKKGKVGIGTTTPAYNLDVNGGSTNNTLARFIGSFAGIQGIQVERNGGTKIRLVANYANYGGGLESSSALRFSVNNNGINNPAILINSNGKVGIGTTTPAYNLDVNGGSTNNTLARFIGSFAGIQGIQVERNGGAKIRLVANYANYGGGLESSSALRFAVGNSGINNPAILINSNGKVGIGTTSPTEQLHVTNSIRAGVFRFNSNGHIIDDVRYDNYILSWAWDSNYGDHTKINWGGNGAGTDLIISQNKGLIWDGYFTTEEIKVEDVTGADFVFTPSYNLMPLSQIESYIKTNHHLPEVPSAAEMQANGIELGKMNMLLLQKIEELTLHQIEMNKLLLEQQKQLVLQNQKIANLENNLK